MSAVAVTQFEFLGPREYARNIWQVVPLSRADHGIGKVAVWVPVVALPAECLIRRDGVNIQAPGVGTTAEACDLVRRRGMTILAVPGVLSRHGGSIDGHLASAVHHHSARSSR
jgi:hypothetical protein